MRTIIIVALIAGSATMAAAQDMGHTSPLDHTPVMALGAAADAQARQVARGRSHRGAAGTTVSDRQTCAELPSYRAKLGASDPRLVKLARLCSQAGYR